MYSRQSFNPKGVAAPKGPHCLVTRVKASELIYISGMVPLDEAGALVGAEDFDIQAAQVYKNIATALDAVDAELRHVVKFTTFLSGPDQIPHFMAFRAREFPQMFPDLQFPSNSLLVVSQLIRKDFLIEVDAVAAI